jgi:hypothetical protein
MNEHPLASNEHGAMFLADRGVGRAKLAMLVPTDQKWRKGNGNGPPGLLSGPFDHKVELHRSPHSSHQADFLEANAELQL